MADPLPETTRPWELSAAERQAIVSEIGDREVIVSLSGGKDSTAACLLLNHLSIPYRAVHMDTGWEDDETDRYVREILPRFVGSVDILVARSTDTALDHDPRLVQFVEHIEGLLGKDYSAMVRSILHKATFSSKRARWCTRTLKIEPFQRYLQALSADVVNVVGIRGEESRRRAKMGEWEYSRDFDCDVWRPLIDWTEADVIAMHHEADCPPNPLYTQGAARVGCWPCIHARKHEVRMVAERSPDRVEVLRQLERAVTWLQAERFAGRGETFESLSYSRPGFFENPFYRTERREHGEKLREECRGMFKPDWFDGQAWVDLSIEYRDELEAGRKVRVWERYHALSDPERSYAQALQLAQEKLIEREARRRTRAMVPVDEVIGWSRTKRGSGEIEPFAPLPHEAGCMRFGFCDTTWRKNVGARIEEESGE